MTGVILKIENDSATVVFEGNDERTVPISTLPFGAGVGDVILFNGIKTTLLKKRNH